jgi:hypothetical protein
MIVLNFTMTALTGKVLPSHTYLNTDREKKNECNFYKVLAKTKPFVPSNERLAPQLETTKANVTKTPDLTLISIIYEKRKPPHLPNLLREKTHSHHLGRAPPCDKRFTLAYGTQMTSH